MALITSRVGRAPCGDWLHADGARPGEAAGDRTAPLLGYVFVCMCVCLCVVCALCGALRLLCCVCVVCVCWCVCVGVCWCVLVWFVLCMFVCCARSYVCLFVYLSVCCICFCVYACLYVYLCAVCCADDRATAGGGGEPTPAQRRAAHLPSTLARRRGHLQCAELLTAHGL